MISNPILNIAEICAQKNIREIILSPGSRNAPLTLAFARHPDMNIKVISDERSAGYVALGWALNKKKPAILICTSGTAAINYGPAVAEAYFQQVPMILLTADRPPEWLEQQEGQTVFQQELYGKHTKKSYQLPLSLEHPDARWQVARIINDAINLSQQFPPGPVHLNIPLREPLYPEPGQVWNYDKNVKLIEVIPATMALSEKQWQTLSTEWNKYSCPLLVAGQGNYDPDLINSLEAFQEMTDVPVLAEITSNLQGLEKLFVHGDIFLGTNNISKLPKVDLLITFGQSIVSKNLKQYLRQAKPKAHWHIAPSPTAPDTFQSLTKVIPTLPTYFFNQFKPALKSTVISQEHTVWEGLEKRAQMILNESLAQEDLNELKAVEQVLHALPGKGQLMLANSMPVRWANLIGLKTAQKGITVYANRGTGGIDGSSSTAVGLAMTQDLPTILITGDMAFFYDRNAFWHQYPLSNLFIILLNNHSGGIFGLIEGPSKQPELEAYFETNQNLKAENTARDFNMEYLHCNDLPSLNHCLKDFFKPGNAAKLLEIEIPKAANKKVYKALRNLINTSYE